MKNLSQENSGRIHWLRGWGHWPCSQVSLSCPASPESQPTCLLWAWPARPLPAIPLEPTPCLTHYGLGLGLWALSFRSAGEDFDCSHFPMGTSPALPHSPGLLPRLLALASTSSHPRSERRQQSQDSCWYLPGTGQSPWYRRPTRLTPSRPDAAPP